MSDGGPAFPLLARETVLTESGWELHPCTEPGMSLRDYFAAHAISACIAPGGIADPESAPCTFTDRANLIALQSYGIADAMIRARDKEVTS